MGAVGGMLGLNGGAGGTGFNVPSGTNAEQLNNTYNQNQTAMGGQTALLTALQGQNGIQNQSNVYNQLQGVVNGTGPNPAQAMLNQTTGQNVNNQAALMAGQRGAASNVGLMARQAAQQGANLQQQAVGQGATMQAQQSLNALGQAGQMATGMANNQIGQTNANTAAIQNEQGVLQGANSANNNVQGQLANSRMGQQPNMIGGAMQGVSSMAGMMGGMADGGAVPMNSEFSPQSMFAQSLSGQSQPATPTFAQAPAQSSDEGAGGAMAKMGPALMAMAASKGGEVPVMVSPGERVLPPGEAKAVAKGKASPMKVGGQVPGQAKVKGDSYKNDTQPAKLPPGSVVIPRSVMNSKNPERGAAEFVRSVLAKKKVRA